MNLKQFQITMLKTKDFPLHHMDDPNSATLNQFRPIFIVGNSRSGTTLMSRILNNSSAVFTFEELHFFEEIWNPKDENQPLPFKEAVDLVLQLLNRQRNGYFSKKKSNDFIDEAEKIVRELSIPSLPTNLFSAFLQYETELNKKEYPCEQTPRNILYLSEILQFFPNARIINMIRDPRDVLLSQKRRWKRPFLNKKNIPKIHSFRYWMNYHPFTISKLWNINVLSGDSYKDDERVFTLKFEDLVNDPDNNVKQICDFLGIRFDSELLDVPQVGSSNSMDDPNRRGIDNGKVFGWRQGGLTRTELYICQKINQDLIRQYGYQIEAQSTIPFFLILSFIFFPIKLFFSLILNLNRVKSLPTSIKRRLGYS